jgi:hypothetical protein
MLTADPRSLAGVRRNTVDPIADHGKEKPSPNKAAEAMPHTGPGKNASNSRPAHIAVIPQ